MNTWVVCCKGLPSEISLRKARKRKHKLKSPTKKDNMRSLVKFIGESMFTCFMCPFTATIESSSSCKLEDHQAAWWQDFWGLPGSMMARPTCKKGSVRPGSVSSSSSSVTLRCLAIMITRSELYLPMSLLWRSCLPPSLPFSDPQIAEPPNPLLQMSLSWFLFKTSSKTIDNLPGYLSWNIQKQGATFFSCMLSLWNEYWWVT